MSTTEPTPVQKVEIDPRRLWFGTIAGAAAWVLLGCIDIVIVWRACMVQGDYGIPTPRPDVRIAWVVVAFAILVVACIAGFVSHRTFRQLTGTSEMLNSLAVEYREFLAVGGVIVTVTMGMGILWLALPGFFLDLCWRAR